MAILTTIITLCTFFAVQIPPSKSDSYSATISDVSECPAKTMFSGPKCEPRLEIVKLPLPSNFIEVAEVLPAFVEVQRCSGNCHEENEFYNCVAKEKSIKKVDVVFRTYGNDLQCSSIDLEEHTECQCGCDFDANSCSEAQVRYF